MILPSITLGTALDVCLDRELLGRIKAAFK